MNILKCVVICALSLLLSLSIDARADVPLADGGVSGGFGSLSRDGEGITVQIIESSIGTLVVVHWFTFDESGNQMWLAAASSALSQGQTVVSMPAEVLEGPEFGPDYDPDDVMRTDWGTLTLSFPNCNEAILSYASTIGFGTGTIPMVRITELEQVGCLEPPSEPTMQTGRWQGPGVCFNVSLDGKSITNLGSTCNNGLAFDSRDLDGLGSNGTCDVSLECNGVFAIVEGQFACWTDKGNAVTVGSFTGEREAFGVASEKETGVDDVCIAPWTAEPD
jgi:hypothetical protein